MLKAFHWHSNPQDKSNPTPSPPLFIDLMALLMLGKHFSTELYSKPSKTSEAFFH